MTNPLENKNAIRVDENASVFTSTSEASIVYSFEYREDEKTTNRLVDGGYFAGGGLLTGRYYTGKIDSIACRIDNHWILQTTRRAGTHISDGPVAGPCDDYTTNTTTFGVEELGREPEVRNRLKSNLAREVKECRALFGSKSYEIGDLIGQLT